MANGNKQAKGGWMERARFLGSLGAAWWAASSQASWNLSASARVQPVALSGGQLHLIGGPINSGKTTYAKSILLASLPARSRSLVLASCPEEYAGAKEAFASGGHSLEVLDARVLRHAARRNQIARMNYHTVLIDELGRNESEMATTLLLIGCNVVATSIGSRPDIAQRHSQVRFGDEYHPLDEVASLTYMQPRGSRASRFTRPVRVV